MFDPTQIYSETTRNTGAQLAGPAGNSQGCFSVVLMKMYFCHHGAIHYITETISGKKEDCEIKRFQIIRPVLMATDAGGLVSSNLNYDVVWFTIRKVF